MFKNIFTKNTHIATHINLAFELTIVQPNITLKKILTDHTFIHNNSKLNITLQTTQPLSSQTQQQFCHILSHLTQLKEQNIILHLNQQQSPQPTAHAPTKTPQNPDHNHPPSKIKIQYAKKLIAVVACKGGVGKSTVSYIIANELLQQGYKVGLMDGDIYGPSIPILANLKDYKPKITPDNKMIPAKKINPHNQGTLQIASMGFAVPHDSPLIWRGPMITKALNSLLFGCVWDDLDYFIIDFPPGTGDFYLSFFGKYLVDQIITITTPSDLSLYETIKTINAFGTFNTGIHGIVGNLINTPQDLTKLTQLSQQFNIPNIANFQTFDNPDNNIHSAVKQHPTNSHQASQLLQFITNKHD